MINDYVTVFRTSFRTPPWLGIGPVKSGNQVVGFTLHMGQRAIAFHKNLAQLSKGVQE